MLLSNSFKPCAKGNYQRFAVLALNYRIRITFAFPLSIL